MKEILADIFESLTTLPHETDEWVIFILMWVVTLIVLALIGAGIFYLFDATFLEKKEGVGIIIAKVFEPSHTSTTLVYNAAAKTSMPITQYHPDAWRLDIQVGDKVDDMYVSELDYVKYNILQHIQVTYAEGRLSGDLYIKTIAFP